MAYYQGDENKKAEVRASLRAAKGLSSYDELVEMTGVNRKELWNIIYSDDYDPPAHVWVQLGVPIYELAPVCPVHGKACVHDCSTHKVVPRKSQPRGQARKYNRCTVYRGTSIEKVKTMLLEVTGIKWCPSVDEIKY